MLPPVFGSPIWLGRRPALVSPRTLRPALSVTYAAIGLVVVDAGHAAGQIVENRGCRRWPKRKRQARLRRIDARDFPSAEQPALKSFLLAEPRLFEHAVDDSEAVAVDVPRGHSRR